jgi:hypothetical protein
VLAFLGWAINREYRKAGHHVFFYPDALPPRAVFMVADLDEAQMTEIMLIVSKKLGTYPEFTPVIPGAATPGIAAKAIEEAKKLP